MNFGSSGDEPLLFFCTQNAEIAQEWGVNPNSMPKSLLFDLLIYIFASSNEKIPQFYGLL
jgi:hypothetical protein